MSQASLKILAVDDEKRNLIIMKTYLEEEGYQVVTAGDGAEAWKLIEKEGDSIQTILIDRMMPNMNGMEFVAQIKQHPKFQLIPVIMQTSATQESQIVEGINAGVFYYLAKPYSGKVMSAIVKAAVKDYEQQIEIMQNVNKNNEMSHLVTQSHYQIRSIDDARNLTAHLAGMFPKPEKVSIGLSEILINAVEHGNLGISYTEKTELMDKDLWEHEISIRLNQAENKDKHVSVSYYKEDNQIKVNIKDQGNGFAWQNYLNIAPDRATDLHGRGIALAKMISFDRIDYKGIGNEVTCSVILK